MSEAPPVRVVYVGRCQLVGNKKGDLWAPVDLVAGLGMEAVQKLASPFSADRAQPIVGGVYEASGVVEDGRLRRLGGVRKFQEALQGPTWDALKAVNLGVLQGEREAAAEAKALREAKAFAPDAIRQLAHIVAQASPYSQGAVIRGLMVEVQRAARELRERRK